MTTILDGRVVAKALKTEIAAETAAFLDATGRPPRLVAVDIAGDAAVDSYVRSIRRACEGAGMAFEHRKLPAETTQAELEATITAANEDATIDGVILQIPLPDHLDTARAIDRLDPRKDVDGAHPINLGRLAQGLTCFVPNTPAGGMELLRYYDIPLKGRKAVVVGRSNVVGKPMALLLLQEHATVTICHSRTADLAAEIRSGDIVAVAVGKAGLVTGDMLKPGAIVLDFGINVDEAGTLTGDVEYASALEVAGAITPVPGGTGPVTNMMLLRNTLRAARGEV